MKKKSLKQPKIVSIALAGILVAVLLISGAAGEASDQQELVDKAQATFESFWTDGDMAWLKENLKHVEGLLIIPKLIKGGLILGGSGGSGVLLVRDEKKNQWSQPAFYTIGSVTFGLQLGGEKAEVIMAVRTRKGLESLYSSSFKLGGDASVAAGPKGGGGKETLTADLISFTRSKGAFAGLSLEGAVIKTKDKWNRAYYEKEVSPIDIIVKKEVSNPGANKLRTALRKAAK